MDDSTKSVVLSQKHNKIKLLKILVGIIIVFTIASLLYFIYQNNLLKKQLLQKNVSSNKTKVVDNTTDKQFLAIPPDTEKSIIETINQLLSNKLEYSSVNNNVPILTKEFDLSQNDIWANMVIKSYRYSPGSIIESGYEGMSWNINLDTEVAQLKNLKSLSKGSYIIQSTDFTGTTTYAITDVKKIGNLQFAATNTYFQPSQSWHRYYRAFDENTNQLVEIVMGIGGIGAKKNNMDVRSKTVCYEEKCADVVIFPLEIETFIKDEERLLVGTN